MIDAQNTERYFDAMFTYVRLLVDIPLIDQELCRKYFSPVCVKKGTVLEKSGTIHQYHNFIVSGFMRNYHLDEDGQEVTLDINDGPRLFTSYHHFIHKTVSNENLHCITDCELLRIGRDDMDISAQQSITQMDYSMKVLQQQLEKDKQRAKGLTTLTAKQRYLKLMEDSPAIIQSVPLKYIASYLGINSGSLSRIRKELG